MLDSNASRIGFAILIVIVCGLFLTALFNTDYFFELWKTVLSFFNSTNYQM